MRFKIKDMPSIKPNSKYGYVIKIINSLLHKSHLHRHPVILLNKSNHLNSAVQMSVPIFIITKGDLERLSHNDLVALLAHEVGHLKANVMWLATITTFIAYSIKVLISIILGLPFFDVLDVLDLTDFIIIVISMSLAILLELHHSEKIADIQGASLVGKKKYIHMLKTFEHDDQNKITLIRRMTNQLWTCPLAFLHCKLILGYCYLKNHFQIVHCSWNHRIKRINRR